MRLREVARFMFWYIFRYLVYSDTWYIIDTFYQIWYLFFQKCWVPPPQLTKTQTCLVLDFNGSKLPDGHKEREGGWIWDNNWMQFSRDMKVDSTFKIHLIDIWFRILRSSLFFVDSLLHEKMILKRIWERLKLVLHSSVFWNSRKGLYVDTEKRGERICLITMMTNGK